MHYNISIQINFNLKGANMNKRKKESYSHPLSPYTEAQWDKWTMYNNIPYEWDEDLYHEKKVQLYSGNLIKSYRCLVNEPLEIQNEGQVNQ